MSDPFVGDDRPSLPRSASLRPPKGGRAGPLESLGFTGTEASDDFQHANRVFRGFWKWARLDITDAPLLRDWCSVRIREWEPCGPLSEGAASGNGGGLRCHAARMTPILATWWLVLGFGFPEVASLSHGPPGSDAGWVRGGRREASCPKPSAECGAQFRTMRTPRSRLQHLSGKRSGRSSSVLFAGDESSHRSVGKERSVPWTALTSSRHSHSAHATIHDKLHLPAAPPPCHGPRASSMRMPS